MKVENYSQFGLNKWYIKKFCRINLGDVKKKKKENFNNLQQINFTNTPKDCIANIVVKSLYFFSNPSIEEYL